MHKLLKNLSEIAAFNVILLKFNLREVSQEEPHPYMASYRQNVTIVPSSPSLEQGIAALINACVNNYRNHETNPTIEETRRYESSFVVDWAFGRSKYIRITSGKSGDQQSAFAFVVKQDGAKFKKGDVLKPKSWSAPTTNHARGNVLHGNYAIQWTGPLSHKQLKNVKVPMTRPRVEVGCGVNTDITEGSVSINPDHSALAARVHDGTTVPVLHTMFDSFAQYVCKSHLHSWCENHLKGVNEPIRHMLLNTCLLSTLALKVETTHTGSTQALRIGDEHLVFRTDAIEDSFQIQRFIHELQFRACNDGEQYVRVHSSVLDANSNVIADDVLMGKLITKVPYCRHLYGFESGSSLDWDGLLRLVLPSVLRQVYALRIVGPFDCARLTDRSTRKRKYALIDTDQHFACLIGT